MYSRMLDGKELTIGVSGMLRKNALVMYDRETETLWSHFTGEALAGPLMGKTLKIVESSPRVKWSEWVKRHPDSKLLRVDGATHARSNYARYVNSPNEGIRPVQNKDGRLPGKDLVLGVLSGGKATAAPMALLKAKGVVHTTLDGKDIAIYFDPELGMYGAVVLPDGVRIKAVSRRTIVAEDGREWSAVDGSSDHGDLEMLLALRTFWFAWADHYPDTDLVAK
ncbi:MAG: DUF3179 domain-containing protein [Armatimonadetes bacterium]|nr:DUF3179 domain-containing protein [Armatimonadota bacterium]